MNLQNLSLPQWENCAEREDLSVDIKNYVFARGVYGSLSTEFSRVCYLLVLRSFSRCTLCLLYSFT